MLFPYPVGEWRESALGFLLYRDLCHSRRPGSKMCCEIKKSNGSPIHSTHENNFGTPVGARLENMLTLSFYITILQQ